MNCRACKCKRHLYDGCVGQLLHSQEAESFGMDYIKMSCMDPLIYLEAYYCFGIPMLRVAPPSLLQFYSVLLVR